MKIIILSLITIQSAMAFRLNTNVSAAFSDTEVKIYVTSNSTCTEAGISNTELLNLAINGAKNYWNKVPTANLTLKEGGILQTNDSKFLTEKLCAEDSITTCDSNTTVPIVNDIVIACNNNSENFPSGQFLALSAPVKLSGSKIKGSIILINDTTNSTFSTLSTSEKESVLAHEIGHAIGLGHSNKDEALMYYKSSGKQFALSQDDIDGMTYLYPNQLDGLTDCSGVLGGTISFIDKNTPKGPSSSLLSMLIGLSIGFLTLTLAKIFTGFRRNRRLSS